METKKHAIDTGLRLPSAGASKNMTKHDSVDLSEELLSVLLHDLRSPLGAIGVLADLITSVSEDEKVPDQRQLQLLQDAVTKAQRVLDDAVEINSVIRGSSTFTPAHVEVGNIVRSCLEKASHAPYFRHVDVDYNANGEAQFLIRVDLEKAETALLCAFEHIVAHGERPAIVNIHHTTEPSYVNIHIINSQKLRTGDAGTGSHRLHNGLRGRLGTRRLGESRYNIQVCRRVMDLMGGELEVAHTASTKTLVLRFPKVP